MRVRSGLLSNQWDFLQRGVGKITKKMPTEKDDRYKIVHNQLKLLFDISESYIRNMIQIVQ